MYEDRIRNKDLLKKVVDADNAALLIENGMHVATSGFTPSGYPKAVPLALAKQINNGRDIKISLSTGASVGDELDGELTRAGCISKRSPYQTNRSIRDAINCGSIDYIDQHLSHTAQEIRYGFSGNVDVAIVEACTIKEKGHIIPTTSVGNSPTFVKEADIVIVEINLSQPVELEGMHDIYIPNDPPNRKALPLNNASDRIGTPYIECGLEKIKAIVVTDIIDNVR